MNEIFLISQPRSGSTLLQTILAQHPNISSHSEPWILLPFLYFFENNKKDVYPFNSNLASLAIDEFLSNNDYKENFDSNIRLLFETMYKSCSNSESKYFLDKTPRYYEILDSICRIFPQSKIIILKRNPFQVLASMVNTWNLKECKELYPNRYDILKAPFLLNDFLNKNKDNPNVYCLKYETLTKNPEEELKRIFAWLNLSFSNEFLSYKKNPLKGNFGDHIGIIKKSKPEKEGLKGYKDLLKDKKWKGFILGYSSFLGRDFLTEYGYKPISNHKKTLDFSLFEFICENELMDKKPIKNHLKNLILRLIIKLKF